MDKIFQDETKLKYYSQLQQTLCEIDRDSTEETIKKIVKQIPSDYKTQKENLLVLCFLFAYYARSRPAYLKGKAIFLFEELLPHMKELLSDDSSFIWYIFGGLFYFKLWMYEEGLIKIETIISSAQNDESSVTIEYFLPEILKEEPELFEKQLKYQIKFEYSEASIEEFKALRKRHFQWLRNSSDFNDPTYFEIEKDQLRLSIKRDDIDTFQTILSNNNITINSNISESLIENFLRYSTSIPLMDFAIEFNAVKIFKFLLMNDADVDSDIVFNAINSRNYEIIHILESHASESFKKNGLYRSVGSWNSEVTEYLLNNYDYGYLQKKGDLTNEDSDAALAIISTAFSSCNFQFFETSILPFLRNNPLFVKEKIYNILSKSICDYGCFFFREFLKYPEIDINFCFPDSKKTLLFYAISEVNTNAFEILLNDPKIDMNQPTINYFIPFQVACRISCDTKVLRLMSEKPGFDIYKNDDQVDISGFHLASMYGSVYALRFIIEKYPDFNENPAVMIIYQCLKERYLYTIKIIFKFFKKADKMDPIDLMARIICEYKFTQDYKEEFLDEIKQIWQEVCDEEK